MVHNRIKQVTLIVLSVLILLGVALMAWSLATADDRDNIDLELSEGVTETISFENLCLLPGDEASYHLNLKDSNTKKYSLIFDFVEKDDKGLKNFVRVKIASGDTVLYDELLSTAITAERIAFDVNFRERLNTQLDITYYLPLDVGNEAKNGEVLFDLLLTATNE